MTGLLPTTAVLAGAIENPLRVFTPHRITSVAAHSHSPSPAPRTALFSHRLNPGLGSFQAASEGCVSVTHSPLVTFRSWHATARRGVRASCRAMSDTHRLIVEA